MKNYGGSMPMGKSDTALVTWLGNKERFADLYNASVFQGEQVIGAEQLSGHYTCILLWG